MIVYITLLFLYGFLAILGDGYPLKKISRQKYTRIVFIAVLPLFFLAAFRSIDVGSDTYSYSNMFLRFASADSIKDAIDVKGYLEPGYAILNYLVAYFGGDYYCLQILESLFIYAILYKFWEKHSDNVFLSCFVFLSMRMFFGTISIVRSYVAQAILLLSIESIQKRKFITFAIFVLIASLFHTSALAFFLLYFISAVKIDKKLICLVIGGSVVISSLGARFFLVLSNVIGKYQGYVESRFVDSSTLATILILAVSVCFFMLATYNKTWASESDSPSIEKGGISFEKLTYYAMIIYVAWCIIGLSNNITERISTHYFIFLTVLIPQCFRRKEKKPFTTNLILVIIVIFLSVYFVIILKYRPNWNNVIPYSFMWS